METFSALLHLCEGNSPMTGENHSQRPVTPSFDIFVDLRLDKQFNSEAVDFRRHRADYDVIVMKDHNPLHAYYLQMLDKYHSSIRMYLTEALGRQGTCTSVKHLI